MDKSGRWRCSGDERWIETLHLVPLTNISGFYPIRLFWPHPDSPLISSQQFPQESTHLPNPASQNHIPHPSLRSESFPTKQNTISQISVHVQTYITQTFNQNIALLKAARCTGVICIRKWQAQSFILRPMCFFYISVLWLGFVLKGKSLYRPTMWKIYIFCIGLEFKKKNLMTKGRTGI